MQQFASGSYIFTQKEPVFAFSSTKLSVPKERLWVHPDFMLVAAQEELSLGIEKIREIIYFLRITPGISNYKIVVIDNFHFATVDAQNAFLKTFEEPPLYAYIFLVTPYIDRLLKTVVSRAQVIENPKSKIQNPKLKTEDFPPKTDQPRAEKLKMFLTMGIAERLLWLEQETKNFKSKVELKGWLMALVDELFVEGVGLLKAQKIKPETIEYLKEVKWKIEQGFPVPKLLLEGFLVHLS